MLKNQHLLPKTTILLKTSNNDAMLLSASIIATGAPVDNSVENQFLDVKKSKNLHFGQKVKIDPEAPICCHEFDLSNITNWQHIFGGPSYRNFCRNFCPRALGHSIFICGADFFHVLIKSTLVGNKNNFCCF